MWKILCFDYDEYFPLLLSTKNEETPFEIISIIFPSLFVAQARDKKRE